MSSDAAQAPHEHSVETSTVPAMPSTFMPASSPAMTPALLSSTTMQEAGSLPSLAAALR